MQIVNFLTKAITLYDTDEISIADGMSFSQPDRIRKNLMYYNSRYLDGQTDEKGRPVPFFNISRDKCELETAAIDFDTKDAQVTTDDPDYSYRAFLFSKENQNWMEEAEIGVWLDDFVDNYSQQGAVLTRIIQRGEGKDKELILENVNPFQLVTDQKNILSNPIIIKHTFSPAELQEQPWDKEIIDELMLTAENYTQDIVEDQINESIGKQIVVHEIHGSFPLSYLKELKDQEWTEEDEKEYVLMVAYLGGVETGTDSESTGENVIVILAEEQDELPFEYIARDPIKGRAWGVSIIEENEEPQKWANDAVQNERLAMHLAGKQIYQQVKGNGLTDDLIENADIGSILTYNKQPAQPLSTAPAALPVYQNTLQKWMDNSRTITNANESVTGEIPPSQTRLGIMQIANQEGTKTFTRRKERIDLHMQKIWKKWVFPFLEEKLSDAHTLTADMTVDELREWDEQYIAWYLPQAEYAATLNGEDFDEEKEIAKVLKELRKQKTQRSATIPKDYYKGWKKKLKINMTNEARYKLGYMETLTNFLNVVPSPGAKNYLMQKLMAGTGYLSPVEIEKFNEIATNEMMQQQAPQQNLEAPQVNPQLANA